MEIKDRIKLILERESLSQVDFARLTGIKPAALSHVLTGRNNASQDVIDRILQTFPVYRESWLVHGIEPMEEEQLNIHAAMQSKMFFNEEGISNSGVLLNKKEIPSHKEGISRNSLDQSHNHVQSNHRRIEKIIVYYTDNTYEVMLPST